MNTNIQKKIINLVFSIALIFAPIINAECAVTYEQSPGRFGDNLLCYMHAKWISYKYNIPLLYKPFIYSDQLELHKHEYRYSKEAEKEFKKKVWVTREALIDIAQDSVLYTIPYFPESEWELKHGTSFTGKKWHYLKVDWNNPAFINQLRALIQPISPMPKLQLPADRITVAVHMRKGGTFDKQDAINAFPLKFPQEEFYAEQIKKIYELINGKPLYVYLFTDDTNPQRLIHNLHQRCRGLDIVFDCKKSGNSDKVNVLEDFFALAQFDCLIRPESNYSIIMGLLTDYKIHIFPKDFTKNRGKIMYLPQVENRMKQ